MFLSIGMLKQKYFLTDIFILSAVFQPIKLSWRKIEWLLIYKEKSLLSFVIVYKCIKLSQIIKTLQNMKKRKRVIF